jgi:hypothetical protein
MFNESELNIIRSDIRTDETRPYKLVRVRINNNNWVEIREPDLISLEVDTAHDQIGRCTFVIHSKNGKYNFREPSGQYSNALNKGRKIEITEGWGNFRRKTFVGYIQKVEMETDGESGVKITVTAFTQLSQLKNITTTAATYAENVNLDKVLDDVLKDVNETLTEPIDYDIAPYTLKEYNPADFAQKWEKFLNIDTPYDLTINREDSYTDITRTYNSITTDRSKNLIILNVYGGSVSTSSSRQYRFRLLIIDLKYNIVYYPNFVSENYRHAGPAIVSDYGMVMAFGSLTQSRVNTYGYYNRIGSNFTVYDLNKRTVSEYDMTNKVPTGVNQQIGTYSLGVDGNIYILTLGQDIIRLKVDHLKKKVTKEYLGTLDYITMSDWTELFYNWAWKYIGHSDMKRVYADVFCISPDTVTVIYLRDGAAGGLSFKDYDVKKGKLELIQEGDIGGYHPIKYLRTFYTGYMLTVVDNRDYMVSNILTHQAERIVMEAQSGEWVYHDRYFYRIPTLIENGKSKIIYRHRVITTSAKIDDLFEPVPPVYALPSQEALPVLSNVLTDTGMIIQDDFETGKTSFSYPTIKEYEDYAFISKEVTELIFKTNDDDFDTVEITYGYGSNTGKITVGEGNKILRVYRPYLNRNHAYTLADRMLNTNHSGILEITGRAIPNLGVGKTISILDPKMVRIFKGICIKYSTTNDESGYWGKWTLLGD